MIRPNGRKKRGRMGPKTGGNQSLIWTTVHESVVQSGENVRADCRIAPILHEICPTSVAKRSALWLRFGRGRTRVALGAYSVWGQVRRVFGYRPTINWRPIGLTL